MAGHSKWKNIRIRKGKQDAIRGKLFTKLGREIIVAAKMGGGDPDVNLRLRLAIEKAKENSLPKENIDRAVARGSGNTEGENYEELVYEGMGPGGVAFMVEVYSENKNRTVGELRHCFSKNGGSMTENGSVAWQFKHIGQIVVKQSAVDEDTLTMAVLDGGADDVRSDDEGNFIVEMALENFGACTKALTDAGIPMAEAGLTRVATNMATPEEDDIPKILKLYDALEELDDVKDTYFNFEIPDDYDGE
jgi:YebC/PmpR family DNA-binding regulatory protein